MFTDAANAVERKRVLPNGSVMTTVRVMKAGKLRYNSDEIGMPGPRRVVEIERTTDTIEHPETKATLRGAPVTLEHPPGKEVTDANWDDVVVGHLVGDPWVEDGYLKSDILVGSRRAIKALDEINEASPGYKGKFDFDNMRQVGPMFLNHVAITGTARAGNDIRLGDSAMDPKELRKAAKEAVMDLLGEDSAKNLTREDIEDALNDRLDPFIEKLEEQQTVNDSATAEKEAAAATAKAREEGRKAERRRMQIYNRSRPFLTPAQARELQDADERRIMEAALGERIKGIENASDDFLYGALATLQAPNNQQGGNQATAGDSATGTGRTLTDAADILMNQYSIIDMNPSEEFVVDRPLGVTTANGIGDSSATGGMEYLDKANKAFDAFEAELFEEDDEE